MDQKLDAAISHGRATLLPRTKLASALSLQGNLVHTHKYACEEISPDGKLHHDDDVYSVYAFNRSEQRAIVNFNRFKLKDP